MRRKKKDRSEPTKRETTEQRQDLERGLIAGQEGERRRLARELHDGLNQKLTILAIELAQLAGKDTVPPEISVRLRQIENRVSGIIDEPDACRTGSIL
jgi:signal transduction histidine kinase